MSFAELDEAPPRHDEPSSRSDSRPPRPSRRPSRAQRQALLRRRLAALGVGLVLLALLVLATRGCLNARADSALREYSREVSALSDESVQESQSLFDVLRGGGDSDPVETQSTVNGLRAQADQLVERARDLKPPDGLAAADDFMVYALEFRRDGLARIAAALPTALGENERDAASARIAAEMRDFLVSDVLFSQRVSPDLRRALHDRDLLADAELPRGGFLPGIDWLQEGAVSKRLSALRKGPGDVAAGTRGLALGVVTAGGETLNESSPTQVAAASDLAFSVQVQNQGAVPEEGVKVSVAITGGAAPLTVERTLESIPAGGSETATLPLAAPAPTGRPVTVKVRVAPAEGESDTADNESSFPATFTSG